MLILLILINIIIWLAITVIGLFARGDALVAFLALPDNFTDYAMHPWSIISYMFSQASFLHMVFNMLWLYWFGIIRLKGRAPIMQYGMQPSFRSLKDHLLLQLDKSQLCSRMAWRLLFLYLAGGISGGVAFMIISASFHYSYSYLLGASAAVMAVITAAALDQPNLPIRLFLFGEVRLKWIATTCIVLTFLGLGGGNTGGQAAHAGGVLAGILWICGERFAPKISEYLNSRHSVAQSHRGYDPVRHAPDAFKGRLCDSDRLDQLLDKIRISGYNSLSEAEKRELDAISSRL